MSVTVEQTTRFFKMEIVQMLTKSLSTISSSTANTVNRRDEVSRKRRSEIENKAFALCKDYLQGPWTHLNYDDFQLTPLGGGLTNKLYICTLPSQCRAGYDNDEYPGTILLRIYGLILEDFKAQIQENVVFTILAERGIGPQLFAVFPGGRLEEFLPGRTLATRDLCVPTISRYIAERVAEYHRLVMPVKKDPSFITNKLKKYFDKTKSAEFKDLHKQQLFEEFFSYDIATEVEYLTSLISETNAVVVFCHNDVQEGNLLCNDDVENGNPVQMIDFEYSSYNYRGFDIGNHFCEWMYDYSYPKWPFYSYKPQNFPSEDQQINFIKAYLASMYKHVPSRKHDLKWSFQFVLKETNRLVLLSHLFWALWSIRQAQISDIEFGYMEYALARMDAYFNHKKLIASLD